ncbi:MAG: hypothetical protein IPP90_02505 [Gemmatimonadaceae bacterium]|nr:hypothetical protein [Gemmatimonadaceae bacterium]
MSEPALPSRLPSARHRRRAIARLVALQTIAITGILVTSCSIGIPTTSAGLNSGQAIMDLESAVLQLREDNALLQAQIDSLGAVTAYQDTILRQLATLSNVTMRPPGLTVP